jgi:hypothetical protein
MVKPSAYSPIDSLVDLACRDGVDIRPTLLRVLTDLYVQKPAHTAGEEIQYVELALALIEAANAPTRTAVAASLRDYPGAPTAVLRKLGATETPLEAPTIQSDPVADNLTELFFAATSEERRLILANLDVAEGATHLPGPAVSDAIGRLEAAALQRNPGEFTRTLERALGLSRALTERVTRDSSGEPLVVAAKALGMPAAVLQRILLFLDPAIGHSIERVYDLARLFDELARPAALHMVSIWQETHARPQPTREPMLWDDERRNVRSTSTAGRQRAVRDRDERSGGARSGGRQA